VVPFEFHQDVWHQKSRIQGLLCNVVCWILHLAILVHCWHVTDK